MFRLSAAVISVGILFAPPIAAEKHPTKDINTLLDQTCRPRGYIGNRTSVIAGKPNLAACLNACDGGTKAIENFCRSLPPDPEMRGACWAVTLGSVPLCKGFCYAWFVAG
jgi:hypothetical protein